VPVRLYDLEPETLGPDLDDLERVLGEGVGAVVIGNLYGFPVPWGPILEACRDAGSVVIEDAAQGLGSSWSGREGGTFGHRTVLSFGRGKGWTGGGGGALLLRGPAAGWEGGLEDTGLSPRTSPSLRSSALTLAQWTLGRPSLYGIPSAMPWLSLGETVYKEPSPLQRIAGFSAALAFATAEDAMAEVLRRRRRALDVVERLEGRGMGSTLQRVKPVKGGDASYLRFPVLLDETASLLRDRGKGGSLGVAWGYPRPLSELAALAELKVGANRSYPGARYLSRRLITLPTHSRVTDRDLDRLAEFLLPQDGGLL
jgi:dTDP-4-amino-4,6-dideoxygalactose transaminase